MKYGLDGQITKSVKNWLNHCNQRTVNSGTMSSWRLVTRVISQESILEPMVFNIIIEGLDERKESSSTGLQMTRNQWAQLRHIGGQGCYLEVP